MVEGEGVPVEPIARGVLQGQRRSNVGAVQMRLKTTCEPPSTVIGQRTIIVEEIIVIAIERGERRAIGIVPRRRK